MWEGGGGNGFLLGKAKKEDVPCRSCGRSDGDGHLFWDCTFLSPSSMFGGFLNLLTLCPLIRSKWPWSLLWHGWLPGLNGISKNNPWAASFGDLASFISSVALVLILLTFAGSWTPPEY